MTETETHTPMFDTLVLELGFNPETVVLSTHADWLVDVHQADWVWDTCGSTYDIAYPPPVPLTDAAFKRQLTKRARAGAKATAADVRRR